MHSYALKHANVYLLGNSYIYRSVFNSGICCIYNEHRIREYCDPNILGALASFAFLALGPLRHLYIYICSLFSVPFLGFG